MIVRDLSVSVDALNLRGQLGQSRAAGPASRFQFWPRRHHRTPDARREPEERGLKQQVAAWSQAASEVSRVHREW